MWKEVILLIHEHEQSLELQLANNKSIIRSFHKFLYYILFPLKGKNKSNLYLNL